MKLKKLSIGLALVSAISFTAVSCGPKDADIKTEITNSLSKPDLMVDVTDGKATISGTVTSEQEKADIIAKVKGTKGVKSVEDNLTIPQPKVDVDAENNAKLAEILKAFPNVKGTVVNGTIMLSGEANKDENMKVMQAVSALNVARVDNKITVK